MRYPLLAFTVAIGLAAAPPTHAGTVGFTTDTCRNDYSTPFDVDVTPAGLSFHRTTGTPKGVFLRDGALSIDGKNVTVSKADADALRRYEAGVRKLMPEVASIAREAVSMGYSAMTTVTLTFAEGSQRAAMLENLKKKQADSLRAVDEGVGAGHWSGDRMTETFAGSVSDGIGELVGSVTSSAVTAAMSGDTSKVAALQARAESLDKSIDREMNKRSKALEARAETICPQLNELADLQRGWSVRLPDGKPLELMTIKPKGSPGDDRHDVASF